MAGAVMLTVTGLQHLRGAVARHQARDAWESAPVLRPAEEARLVGAHAGARPKRWPVGASIARLTIPAIGFDEVVVEGVGSRELAAGPGHLPGSVLPGEAGNSVISAHRDRHFRRLDKVRIGDTVVTETNRGPVTWRIMRREIVERDAPALFTTSTPTLTLTTCWPVRYLGPAPDRLILTAEPVRSGALAVAGLDRTPSEGR
jgi:LPXTG-site transpeptidase (sortase) family protein